jgi:hypothetical protein
MVKIVQFWIAVSLLFTIVAGDCQIEPPPGVCVPCGNLKRCCLPAVCKLYISIHYTSTTLTITSITTTVVPTSVLEYKDVCIPSTDLPLRQEVLHERL